MFRMMVGMMIAAVAAGAVGVIGVKLLLLQGVLPLVFVIPPGRLIHSQPFCNIFDSIALFIVYS